MKHTTLRIFIILIVTCHSLLLAQKFDYDELVVTYSSINLSAVKETVYTLSPAFVEVDLSTQMGYLYKKGEPVKEFGVSSGTK